MASSTLFKLNTHTFNKSLNQSDLSICPPNSVIFSKPLSRHSRLNHKTTTTTRFFIPLCFSLPSPSSSPPISKEEAIRQAKTSLSSCLIKPLNNPKLASSKLKKLKQPRFRLEIPILDDDSPSSLSQLAFSIFHDLPISRRRSSNVKFLFLWPNLSFLDSATKLFRSDSIQHIAMITTPILDSAFKTADVAVFMAPEKSQLEDMKTVSEAFSSKPVVMINPRWLFEEEKSFGDDEVSSFISSFEVIYAFTGLEVRGLLSKRKGVIFKCVRDGVVSGERWNVLVENEEEGNGTLKVVSQFKARPSMDEVELVLYNFMAMNSPITKSAKFLKDLVSNITGKKKK